MQVEDHPPRAAPAVWRSSSAACPALHQPPAREDVAQLAPPELVLRRSPTPTSLCRNRDLDADYPLAGARLRGRGGVVRRGHVRDP